MPNPDTSNVSSFFYTDDSYGRDDFVRKSNLASVHAGEILPVGQSPLVRRPSSDLIQTSASHASAQKSLSSDGSVGSAAVAAISAVHESPSGKKKAKRRSHGALEDPLLVPPDDSLEETSQNPLRTEVQKSG